MKHKKSAVKIFCLLLLIFHGRNVFGQEFLFPLNRDVYGRVEQYIGNDSLHFFSSLKPFDYDYLRKFAPVD